MKSSPLGPYDEATPGSNVAAAAGLLTTFLGVFVLTGWTFDIEVMKTLVPGYIVMLPNAAVAFVAAGASLYLQRRPTPARSGRVAARWLAVLALTLGGVVAVERALGVASPLDLLLFDESLRHYPYRPLGQMATNSAISFVLLGSALLLLDARTRRGVRAADLLAGSAFLIAFLALTGYLFGANQLYTFDIAAAMAFITAITFAVLSIGILYAGPGGIIQLASGNHAGAVLTQRLLPSAIVLTMLTGWLWILGMRHNVFGRETGVALFVVLVCVCMAALIGRSARDARDSESERLELLELERAARERAEHIARDREILLLATERARVQADDARGVAEAARSEAESANAAKTDFLAAMSHELRTPLNAIAGYAQLIEMGIYGEVSAQQADVLGRLQRAQGHLLTIINDILNFAKLEAGATTLEVRAARVADVLLGIDSLVEPQCRKRGLSLTVCPAGELAVRADVERTRQILLNLLSNATRFAREGGFISIATSVEGRVVRFTVEDDGPGIPAGELERVFDPFVQLERSLTSGHHGTGLGLSISRELARLMGGDLVAESRPGAGATFHLTLPDGSSTIGMLVNGPTVATPLRYPTPAEGPSSNTPGTR